jgi:hypothetical protein
LSSSSKRIPSFSAADIMNEHRLSFLSEGERAAAAARGMCVGAALHRRCFCSLEILSETRDAARAGTRITLPLLPNNESFVKGIAPQQQRGEASAVLEL